MSVWRLKENTGVAVIRAPGCWSFEIASWSMPIAKDFIVPLHPEVKARPVTGQCSRTYWLGKEKEQVRGTVVVYLREDAKGKRAASIGLDSRH